MRAAFVGLVGVLLAAAPAADPVTLRWKLAKGDQFFVRSVLETQQTVGVLGMNQEINQTITTVTRFKVLEAGAEGMTVEQTILRADATGGVPGAADQTAKMKGATLTFKLDKELKVTAVEGFDKYLEQVAGGDDPTAKVMKASISEDTLKVTVEDLLNPGPGKPVKPGDKWTRQTKLGLGPLGEFKVDARYTLDGVDGGTAKVVYDADAAFAPGKGGEGLPFEIKKGEIKADKYEGSLRFDPAAGRLKETAQNVKMSGTLTVSAAGNEIELTFNMTQKGSSTVTDKDPGD